VHAPAVPAPGPARWAQVDRAEDEYRRVVLTGRFQHENETLVQASTERGSGFWVLTPLRSSDGSVVLVNRGFVPPEARSRAARRRAEPQDEQTVVGLLRMTEPGGGFLRRNDPAQERWFSRDVQAIAAARGLANVAPYFVDAEAAGQGVERDGPDAPIGGLTVVSFPNTHLVYAITWYGLAALVVVAGWIVARRSEDSGHD
jgi:surfeit locus 1 family protein